eukprot:g3761.t1
MKENYLKAAAASVTAQMAAAEERLKEAVSEVDARALLSSYAMYRMVGMADESGGDHGRPAVAAIELAAYFLMPYFGNTSAFSSEKIQKGIDALTAYQKLFSLNEALGPVDDESAEEHDSLRLHLRLHAGMVRGSAYPGQVVRRIKNLFEEFEADLKELAGIGPLRCSSSAMALLVQIEDNLNGNKERVVREMERVVSAVQQSPALREKAAMELQDFVALMGCDWPPTFEQISTRMGGLGTEEWDAFLSIFGLGPESLSTIHSVVDVQDRPVIVLDSDHVFVSHGVAVFDAIFNHFDALARSKPALRDPYARQLSGWMETELASYLKRLFPKDCVIRSACYPDPDRSDVFLHYIERRIAHQKLDIGMRGDELDIFGHYLDNRLHPDVYENREEVRKGPERKFIAFHGGEERFEPFYVAEWYGTESPEEPAGLDVPDEVRSVLDELRTRTDYGARWIAFALLGLNNTTIEKLASALRDLGSSKAKGERIHRITMREGSVVLNIMAHRGLTERKFFENVTARARIEHYRHKVNTTVSIGINQKSAKAFEVAQWLEGEWEYEEELEKILEEDREKPRNLIPSSRSNRPGRNEPCPCGSGQKFKKCCIERIRFDSGKR